MGCTQPTILAHGTPSPQWIDGASPLLINEAVDAAAIELRYAGYLRRQSLEIERMAAMESRRVPGDFDFARVPGLRAEARERLTSIRPQNVGQARRIPGLTPADITLLALHLDQRAH